MNPVICRKRALAVCVSSALASVALFQTGPLRAEDLGVIHVDSTTIDDRFDSKRNEPSNIGVISGEQIDREHPENIQQVLQRIPGITTEVQSGDSIKIHIRGVENQVYMGEKPGVAVVIDGVPVFERTGRVNIDLDNIQSVKVIKGGASYLFGDDALAGAVIITTKRGAEHAGYKAEAEAGSFGHYKGLLRAGYAGENSNGHIQVSHRETDGYYDDSASEADYLNGKFQYYIDDASDLTFGLERSERMKNSHGAVRGVTAAANDPRSTNPAYNDYANHYDVSLGKYFATYSRDLSETNNLLLNVYQFTDSTAFLSAPLKTDPTAYQSGNDYYQVQRGIKSEFRSAGENVAWMGAVDLRANSYDNESTALDCSEAFGDCTVGAATSDNTTDEQVRALYGELKVRVTDPFSLTFNGRIDQIDLDYQDNLAPTLDGEKTFNVWSWRVGGNYAARSNLDLYGNVSTGFRAPSVEQLFVGSNSPTHRTAANPDLEPERAVNTELGLRSRMVWGGIPWDLDVAVFQIDRKDHIQASGGQYSTAADSRYENIGDLRNRGLELSLLSDPARRVFFDLAYTYLDATYTAYDSFNQQLAPVGGICPEGATPVSSRGRITNCLVPFDNTGNVVPRVPRHHLNIALGLRPAERWLVTTEVDAISSYYADEINQEKIGGHAVVNLITDYSRRIGQVEWGVFARVDNVLDRRYYNTVRGTHDSNADGVYDQEDLSIVVNQGRTYTAGLSAAF